MNASSKPSCDISIFRITIVLTQQTTIRNINTIIAINAIGTALVIWPYAPSLFTVWQNHYQRIDRGNNVTA